MSDDSIKMRAEAVAGPAVASIPWQGGNVALLAQLCQGGRRAAQLLHDCFKDDINRIVWRLLGADPDHDDLVHDAYIQILKDVGRIRDADRLRAWVRAVAVNTVRRELKRRSVRRRFHHSDPEAMHRLGVGPNAEASYLLQRTMQALARVSPKYRIAFMLRYVEQHSLDEVAELCGCSLATVKRRISRAEKRLATIAKSDPALWEFVQQCRWRHDP